MNPLPFLACMAAVGVSGCTSVTTAWQVGWGARDANDRIMLVRRDPPSFGLKRLAEHQRLYPDVAVFVSQAGTPDFIAEMTNRDRHYLIFYYLRTRRAFACRTEIGNRHEVEFAGPYPVTPREYATLTGFRRQARMARVAPGIS